MFTYSTFYIISTFYGSSHLRDFTSHRLVDGRAEPVSAAISVATLFGTSWSKAL